MKLVYTLLLFCTAFCHGQDAAAYTFTPDSDTALSVTYKNQRIAQFGFEPIETSRADYAVRLSWYGTRIEAYRNLGQSWGFVTLIADEIEESRTERKFWMQFSLPPEVADEIISLTDGSGLESVPSQNKIKGWKDGFDGRTYIIETKNEGQYSFKTYWSPELQDVPEAKIINQYTELVRTLCNYKKIAGHFEALIPFFAYTIDGLTITARPTSEAVEKRQKYLEERQAILRQGQTKN
ncbi:hypothetical protein AM493_01630 [Flavobacterium akiainvivens]|uniref:Uncharacterized protein n=1 Tax=Flavobacterium akiainvivens TaxID=1202724 RepID=A0A0M8M8S4_9FLAO|nr:hypothetical protein [Flavobacterium akiainvivens]KOS04885.1 hypothetical protein AM493_01630 [Flavobacterium akiainvivens]SFQ42753.1 hypothetical protein SAMN05444144_104197 [Flavobacterium akiainvivens]